MSLTLVIGGARSGKSRHAQSLALGLSTRPLYVATSRIWDDDHAARIERHRRDRGPEWRSVECELELAALPLAGEVAVIDCVTLWLSNFFSDLGSDVERCLERARSQIDQLATLPATLIIVSNELGQGLHATTEVGRKFTDLQGLVNQHIAARAENVAWMVAGIPCYVKGKAPSGG
ncbi:MAG TPA: bifunctional adenosylcobinamide kinase/adenosylcobinamide-phosphate guanylyltransferase [Polyangiaceae bacterium]|nr:bifunctional adenosylcobinamide kinase/adenosylcobinamide-phosphate guanylyltransferase [Polyangiaceae bacterium]